MQLFVGTSVVVSKYTLMRLILQTEGDTSIKLKLQGGYIWTTDTVLFQNFCSTINWFQAHTCIDVILLWWKFENFVNVTDQVYEKIQINI